MFKAGIIILHCLCYNFPMAQVQKLTYFSRSRLAHQDGRITEQFNAIAQPDRRVPFYIIGRPGTGKSSLMKHMLIQDIAAGRGTALIDPHGDLAEEVLAHIPPQRYKDVILIDPLDTDWPVGINLLEKYDHQQAGLIPDNLVSMFHSLWPEFWGPRLANTLYYSLAALLENKHQTILGVRRLLVDGRFRQRVVQRVNDVSTRFFWEMEFPKDRRLQAETVSPIQNKISRFMTPVVRNIVGQSKSTVRAGNAIKQQRILIVKLSKGLLGAETVNLLGSLILTDIMQAAMAQAGRPEAQRRDFYVYVDEFQNFLTRSFAAMLSETRKFQLNLCLAHQHLHQLPEDIKHSVLGNAGTLVAFRTGVPDARLLEREFLPHHNWQDLVNLSPHQMIYKVQKHGQVQLPDLGQSLEKLNSRVTPETRERLQQASRRRYGRERAKVEQKINRFLGVDREIRKNRVEFKARQ